MIQRQQVVSLAAVRTARMVRGLLTDLEAFCLQLPDYELERAQEMFFGPEGPDEVGAEPESAFVDWLAFDYGMSETGETVLELFMTQRSTAEQTLMAGWVDAPSGLYRVLRREQESAVLEPVAGGGPTELAVMWPAEITGEYVLARWLPVEDRFWHGFHVMIVPPEIIAGFTQVLESELGRMRRSQPDAHWQELFRDRLPLVRDLMAVVGVLIDEGRQVPVVTADGPCVCGETDPIYYATAMALDTVLAQTGVPWDDRQYVMGLWWDIAHALQPRIREPRAWAALAADVWYRSIMGFDMTVTETATDFDVTASSVTRNHRKVMETLSIEPLDDRYTPPLYSMARLKVMEQYMGDWSVPAGPPLPESLRWFKPEVLGMVEHLNHEAWGLISSGDFDAARKRLSEAIMHCPVYPPALISLAQIAVFEGEVEGAIQLAEAALEAHPGYPIALAVLAGCHAYMGKQDLARICLSEAIDVFQQWRRLYPAYVLRNPEIWEHVRSSALAVGDHALLKMVRQMER